ncbi:GNAT family N-acetyltransferase [Sphingomonas rosea]|uniref:GNAT family N-acetyltransferase n=1 Tax=Sphingomonas rosea TaxID=335605 RepID=A0ABP7TYI6_9SPHN
MDVVNNAEMHRFEIELPDGAVAFADYRRMDGRVMFPHTVVPPAHEGQGLASKIARASLDWARSEGLKVIPACSFYRTYLQRHPEYQDLLHND